MNYFRRSIMGERLLLGDRLFRYDNAAEMPAFYPEFTSFEYFSSRRADSMPLIYVVAKITSRSDPSSAISFSGEIADYARERARAQPNIR